MFTDLESIDVEDGRYNFNYYLTELIKFISFKGLAFEIINENKEISLDELGKFFIDEEGYNTLLFSKLIEDSKDISDLIEKLYSIDEELKKITLLNEEIQQYYNWYSEEDQSLLVESRAISAASDYALIPTNSFRGVINENDGTCTRRKYKYQTGEKKDFNKGINEGKTIIGDKLYGLRKVREGVYEKLEEAFGKSRDAIIIDEYHNEIGISLGYFKEQTIHHRQTEEYRQFLIRKLAEKNIHNSAERQLYFTGKREDKEQGIKRGCKLGIDFIKEKGRKIRFIIDNEMDYEAIASEAEKNGKSITASELRKIYKNWESLKNSIVFYHKKEEGNGELERISAPWEDEKHKKLWERGLEKKVPKQEDGELRENPEVKGQNQKKKSSCNCSLF